MEVLQRQDDLGQVEAGRVLHEDALALQVHEELAAREVLQDQVQLAARLERVHQVHDKRVLRAGRGSQDGVAEKQRFRYSFRVDRCQTIPAQHERAHQPGTCYRHWPENALIPSGPARGSWRRGENITAIIEYICYY